MAREFLGRSTRPRLLLAYSDSAHASRSVRFFRRLGWEVHMVPSGVEAQRLVKEMLPHAVALDVDLPDESGWLTAAKILLVQPAQRVLLIGERVDDVLEERARAIGALGVARRAEGPEALGAILFGHELSIAV